MAKERSAAQERAQLESRTLARIKWLESYTRDLREAEGRTITREEFAKQYLDMSYGAYVNALSRGSFRTVNLLVLAKRLDLSMDFICGLTDEMHPPEGPARQPTIWEMRKRAGLAS